MSKYFNSKKYARDLKHIFFFHFVSFHGLKCRWLLRLRGYFQPLTLALCLPEISQQPGKAKCMWWNQWFQWWPEILYDITLKVFFLQNPKQCRLRPHGSMFPHGHNYSIHILYCTRPEKSPFTCSENVDYLRSQYLLGGGGGGILL